MNNLLTILKPILVLIITVLLILGAVYLINTKFIDYVQTNFYNPSVVNSIIGESNKDAQIVQDHIDNLQNIFLEILDEKAVRESFLYNQSAEDIYERSRLFSLLLEKYNFIQSVQFVDSNGIRLHYSTSARDILSRDDDSITYRNYTDNVMALPYETVSVSASNKDKITMDDKNARLVYSFPFYDSIDVYRGTVLFNVLIRTLNDKLISEGRISVNDGISITRMPPGIIIGVPETTKTEILNKISDVWSGDAQKRVILDAGDTGTKYTLFSVKTNKDIYFARLLNNDIFSIQKPMKIVLYISIFATIYLIIYFSMNLRIHPVTQVQNRIKTLRANLFDQLYLKKDINERAKWIFELRQRRIEIHNELKYDLKINEKTEKKIDILIDEKWDELLEILKTDKEQKQDIKKPEQFDEVDSVEEAEELGEVETVEEDEELEEVDSIEEAEELDEVDSIEEAGELDEVDSVEEAEELDDVETVEEAEELDDVETVDEFEEIDDVDSLDKVEQLGEVERLDGSEKLDEAVQLDEVEQLDEIDKTRHISFLSVKPGFDETPHYEKEILAAASEIEFNQKYPANIKEKDNEELDKDLNIVSPFKTMLSDLDTSNKYRL